MKLPNSSPIAPQPQQIHQLKSIETLRAEREKRTMRQAFFGDVLAIVLGLALVLSTIYAPGMYESVSAILLTIIDDKTYLFAIAGILFVSLIRKIRQYNAD